MQAMWVRSLGQGDSPGEGNGNPLQYSCWENSMDRGAWQATVHGAAKSLTWLSEWITTNACWGLSGNRSKAEFSMGLSRRQWVCLTCFSDFQGLQQHLVHHLAPRRRCTEPPRHPPGGRAGRAGMFTPRQSLFIGCLVWMVKSLLLVRIVWLWS